MKINTTIEHELLIEACKKGNEKAQLRVYELYVKAMYNTALRIVKSTNVAEDITQESFITAFEKMDQFRAEVSFGAWLKRIVINKSIVQYHKTKKENWISLEDNQTAVCASENNPSSEAIEELDGKKTLLILETLKTLNPRYELILTLHLIEGYDNEELSTILQLADGTVRTLLSRAKEKLRLELIKHPKWNEI